MKNKIVISAICLSIVCSVVAFYMISGNGESSISNLGFSTKEKSNSHIGGSEVDIITMDATMISVTKEDVLDTSEIILRGEIVEQLPGEYTNPNGTLRNKEGNIITNAWETRYVVKISEVYKGHPKDEKDIIVKTWNRIGLPPLDESKYVLETDIAEFYLDVGDECLLCLTYSEENTLNSDKFGYEVVYGGQGYFKNTGIKNIFASTKLELNLVTIQNDIIDAAQYIVQIKTDSPLS